MSLSRSAPSAPNASRVARKKTSVHRPFHSQSACTKAVDSSHAVVRENQPISATPTAVPVSSGHDARRISRGAQAGSTPR
jgi:hypothetical protein